MRVIQALPVIAFGDAIGNHTIALSKVIKDIGYETGIYAEVIDSRLPIGTAIEISNMPELEEDDVIIYHLSTGSKLNYQLANWKGRKIINYHNITPPYFFSYFNTNAKKNCEIGLNAAKWLADKVDYCIADSAFNEHDLREMGYTQPIDILPIVIPFSDYKKLPSKKILDKYDDGKVNLLFTGRIVPNKKQEDVIKAFYYYKRYYNRDARLFLVGTYTGMESYYQKLQEYVEALELEDVVFTGHVKFDEILAYYKLADVFVCMSEHEGFCVPLVEAMLFDTPIVTYDAGAVADTMQAGGILLKEKEPKYTAGVIDYMIRSKELQAFVLKKQKLRLEELQYEKVANDFKNYLEKFIRGTV